MSTDHPLYNFCFIHIFISLTSFQVYLCLSKVEWTHSPSSRFYWISQDQHSRRMITCIHHKTSKSSSFYSWASFLNVCKCAYLCRHQHSCLDSIITSWHHSILSGLSSNPPDSMPGGLTKTISWRLAILTRFSENWKHEIRCTPGYFLCPIMSEKKIRICIIQNMLNCKIYTNMYKKQYNMHRSKYAKYAKYA